MIGNPIYTDFTARPDDRICSKCNCCPVFWTIRSARKGRKARWESTPCRRCDLARKHTFKSHLEMDSYLDKGCWIDGGLADRIDHDHSIHPIANHSCDECRRGPICHEHNMWLQEGKTSEDIRKNALKYKRAGEQGLVVAEVFSLYERKVSSK